MNDNEKIKKEVMGEIEQQFNRIYLGNMNRQIDVNKIKEFVMSALNRFENKLYFAGRLKNEYKKVTGVVKSNMTSAEVVRKYNGGKNE